MPVSSGRALADALAAYDAADAALAGPVAGPALRAGEEVRRQATVALADAARVHLGDQVVPRTRRSRSAHARGACEAEVRAALRGTWEDMPTIWRRTQLAYHRVRNVLLAAVESGWAERDEPEEGGRPRYRLPITDDTPE